MRTLDWHVGAIHCIRIVSRRNAESNETGIDVHYLEHFSSEVERWHPVPAPAQPGASIFKNFFKHPTDADANGHPLCVKDYFPVATNGR